MIVENICCQGSVLGYEFYFRSNEQLENAVLTGIPVTNMNEVSEKFFSYWCDLLYGKITADEMCEEAQASVQELLDKNNK